MIQKIAKLAQNLKVSSPTTYNAALPMLIKVLAQTKGDTYLLQVGSKQIQSKSHKELFIGQKYWGEMGKSSLGHITLRNLIPQPNILESFSKAPLQFSLQDLQELGEQKDIFEGFKDFLSQKLATAQSKEEFLFLSNLLLGLKSGVLSLAIAEKNEILQMKKIGANTMRFSAIMPSLGIIEGEMISITKGGNALSLKVMYESTKALLEKNLSLLKGFKLSKITLDSSLKPLYEFKESLLDVRG